jgi:hypothetical protein
MDHQNHITGCTGSAVKFRHCPATVMDSFLTTENHCAQREGGRRVLSQETGLVINSRNFRRGSYASHFDYSIDPGNIGGRLGC